MIELDWKSLIDCVVTAQSTTLTSVQKRSWVVQKLTASTSLSDDSISDIVDLVIMVIKSELMHDAFNIGKLASTNCLKNLLCFKK